MKIKSRIGKRLLSIVLTLALLMSGITLFTSKIYAAGWLDYANQTITLGTAVSGSIKDGDYYGEAEDDNRYFWPDYYWHVYKFSMPYDGLLNIYVESTDRQYFGNTTDHYDGFAIFDGTDPDILLWRQYFTWTNNKLEAKYSSARGMYYGTAEVSLNKGDYYFTVRQCKTLKDPYYLTLSYKEPVINVSSISLTPSSLTMEVGEQRTIIPSILPNNATDKTLIWQSSNPSVATVEDGTVTALSVGSATITATSADGEITASCPVVIRCEHTYKTSLVPASKSNNGSLKEECTKCGYIRQNVTVYAINDIRLSKVSYTYNGKVCSPAVTVKDSSGKTLVKDKDYTVTYSGNRKDVGIYKAIVTFKSNYKGTEAKQFTIYPKSTKLTSVKSKRKGFLASWKKQSTQISGYELAYSINSKFKNGKASLVVVSKNKTQKTISGLEKGKKYYVRIRTYKNVKANGQNTKLYSSWSKTKKVTIK